MVMILFTLFLSHELDGLNTVSWIETLGDTVLILILVSYRSSLFQHASLCFGVFERLSFLFCYRMKKHSKTKLNYTIYPRVGFNTSDKLYSFESTKY